ncbi:complement component C6 isoform X2 [Sciurus carolinensis]|uniref:complement component C6 isoform X2 n=1 Tax=Sciurus carolinensis TaxID=30640 RepID=UPI001FB33F63|nr:complement component C6 isoform X2 [Sciurus carolinensis]
MARHFIFYFILLTALMDRGQSCFCDHYPWTQWSSCSKTCNTGTQSRQRQIVVDNYYWDNSCDQLCTKQETRQCNWQTCPINCLLGDYGPWSDCDPCVQKQTKVRSVLRPSQFEGQPCTEPLVTFQPCIPSKLCQIEETDCKNKFRCDSGRCIASKLECNGENDCGDNSDERDCGITKAVCPRKYNPIPSVQLMGTGFHFLAGEPRGEVLDNSFTGGICKTVKSSRASNPYRVPANLENVNFEVQTEEDDLETDFYRDLVDLGKKENQQASFSGAKKNSFHVPIFYSSQKSESIKHNSAFKQAIQASHKKDSSFIRIHKAIKVLNFTMKSEDLQLSDVFLKALNHLPLEYNSALYSRIFEDFGTHYFTSGSLGGVYDLLYQFSREELKNSGLTEDESRNCVRIEKKKRIAFFKKTKVENRCTTNKLSEKYEGAVDGNWGCWSTWSMCDPTYKRSRTRECNNPAPQQGGRGCEGEKHQEEDCTFSIMENNGQPCISDNEEIKEVDLPELEVDSGCLPPVLPENGFIWNEKKLYSVGEEVEISCLTGFRAAGYQYFRCLPDGTWRRGDVDCQPAECLKPVVQEGLMLMPFQRTYKIGESIELACPKGFVVAGPSRYTCKGDSWTPPISNSLTCEEDILTKLKGHCQPGQKQSGSECICMSPEEDCGHSSEDICVFDMDSSHYFTSSACKFLAEKCLNNQKFHFLHIGSCQDGPQLKWRLERTKLASNSTKKESCGYNTCYDWENCLASSSTCVCLLPPKCPKGGNQLYCIKIGSLLREKTANICEVGALRCADRKVEILHPGRCPA